MTTQHDEHSQDGQDNGYDGPSKSALKRESHSLQKMGETLAQLSPSVLRILPLPERLAEAIVELQDIKSRGAAKRQRQYIGKVMRNLDPEPIREALEALEQKAQKERNQFHAIERWRDRFMVEGESVTTEFIDRFPDTDRQQLRSLVRSLDNAISDDQRSRAARRLFKFLREAVLAGRGQATEQN